MKCTSICALQLYSVLYIHKVCNIFCNIPCTLYNIQFTQYTVHRTQYTVHNTLHSVHCSLYNVHYSLYSVHNSLYRVHCSLYGVHFTISGINSSAYNIFVDNIGSAGQYSEMRTCEKCSEYYVILEIGISIIRIIVD